MHPIMVRMLDCAGWRCELEGRRRDFPELAHIAGRQVATVSPRIRFKGLSMHAGARSLAVSIAL